MAIMQIVIFNHKDTKHTEILEETLMVDATVQQRPMTEEADFLKIKNWDHIHWWVGNAKQSMFYWWKGFGCKPVAYSGLETGNRNTCSYVLESGKIRIVVSSPYNASSE